VYPERVHLFDSLHGPLTAVTARDATEQERGETLTAFESAGVIRALARAAGRVRLEQLARLGHPAGDRAGGMPSEQLMAGVLREMVGGRLLLLRGWRGLRGQLGGALTDPPDIPAQPLESEPEPEHPYRVRLHDARGAPLPGIRCVVRIGSAHHDVVSDRQGWISFDVGAICPERATIEWDEQGEPRRGTVALNCDEGRDPQALARARLHNLGYPIYEEPAAAVALFEVDHDLGPAGLDGSVISTPTADAIQRVWEQHHG
jgi:hypothetical protein